MKLFTSCLLLCAVVGVARAQFEDSPVVAAAKAAHFEAVRRAEKVIANGPPPANRNRVPVEETTQHKLGLNVNETPEVAAAKAAHFEAVRAAEEATAIANATARYPDSSSVVQQFGQHQRAQPAPQRFPSPTSAPIHVQHSAAVVQTTQHKLGVNVQETPEVAEARAAHYEALRRAEQAAAQSGSGGKYYEETYAVNPSYQSRPIVAAVPVIRSPVRETPEVIAAKASHFEAHRRAQLVGGPRLIEPNSHYGQRAHQVMYVPPTYTQNVDYGHLIRMVPVAPAIPQTNQHKLGVNVVDTPEVAAAKAAHLDAYRQAELAAAKVEKEYPNMFAPRNNYYINPARQYGQVNY